MESLHGNHVHISVQTCKKWRKALFDSERMNSMTFFYKSLPLNAMLALATFIRKYKG